MNLNYGVLVYCILYCLNVYNQIYSEEYFQGNLIICNFFVGLYFTNSQKLIKYQNILFKFGNSFFSFKFNLFVII